MKFYIAHGTGPETQNRQHKTHELASADAFVSDGRAGWVGADVGMGPPASCLHASAPGNVRER